MIKIKNLNLTKNNKVLLNNINLNLDSNKIHAFVGNSGAGKTALFKCLTQLYIDYNGEIFLNNTSVKELRKTHKNFLGFVGQKYNLFPHMTVTQNVMHPIIKVLKLSKKEAIIKVNKLLELLDIEQLKDLYPKQISGGQQQRVAIARSLSLDPKIIIFDEPTSALDPYSTNNLKIILKNLCDMGITILFSSHDILFIKNFYNKIYFIEQGLIIEEFDDISCLPENSKIYNFLNYA